MIRTGDASPAIGRSRQFVVAMKVSAAARFRRNEPALRVTNWPTTAGVVDLTFRTLYDHDEYGAWVPREMWVDATGTAEDLETAIESSLEAASSLLPVIGLACNAPIGDDLDAEIAYESTPGQPERPFRQLFRKAQRGLPLQGRRIDVATTVRLLHALDASPHRNRLMRAIGHYHLALGHWRPGRQVLAVEHLWMAVEALAPAVLRLELDRLGVDEETLGRRWHLDPARDRWRYDLLAEAKRRLIFNSDTATYKACKNSSDGLEHGYDPFSVIREAAGSAKAATAAYVRNAIIAAADVDGTARLKLQQHPYDRPLESWPLARIWHGTLVSESDELAATGQEHPFLVWEWSVRELIAHDNGEIDLVFNEKITVSCGEEVNLRSESVELRGPQKDGLHQSIDEPVRVEGVILTE